ncbi:7-cyano-7-deazaguanine synthase QueC [Planctomycetales bacterium ZRK34]|nr:7-cyano-7-deazaguanine synthase QueC [Planctomycetales bacterium ZRK34]
MTDSPPASSRAVVLLSGGLDSATVLAIAKHAGHTVTALSFDYGQRHRHELRAAEAVANSFDITDHRLARIDLRAFGGSALTDTIDVPKDRDESAMSHGIPVTYVPARNTIFLSYALALAEVIGAADIYIGVNAVDYSGYPDCRPQYIQAFEQMANLATRAAVEGHIQLTVHTPLIDLPKPDIIRRGLELGVDYALTHSCYDPLPGDKPCEHCDACLIRQRAFASLGMTDPVLTQARC